MSRARDLAEAGSVDFLATQGRRNLIINGGFDVWQRGTSFTSGLGYTADRFLVYTDGAATVSREPFAPGQTAVPGNPKFFYRHAQTNAGTIESHFSQKLEDVTVTSGRTVTLQFYVKSSLAAQNVYLLLQQNFGSGGSTAVDTAGPSFTVGQSWEYKEITIEVPSVSGKTIGADNFARFYLRFEEGTTFTLDIANVQLELGDTATPFEQRSYGEELGLCQRYFERISAEESFSRFGSGVATSNNEVKWVMVFSARKRTQPLVSFSGAIREGNTNTAIATPLSSVTTTLHNAGINSKGVSVATGNGALIISDSNEATYFDFDSEL